MAVPLVFTPVGQAKALAREVGATDIPADALNAEGCIAPAGRDPVGTELLRRSLELAPSHNLQQEAGRAYATLCGLLVEQFRFGAVEQYLVDGAACCEEHDLDGQLYCRNAVRTGMLQQWGAGPMRSSSRRPSSTAGSHR